ncbi:MAG: hypothetical protein F6K34_26910, partial [Okeania sp. SIO4D6]|nr:hypothetical protein [Okeania sp. SIO4D6]
LLEDPSGALTEILTYHVVEGAVPAETVVTLDAATTLLGEDVTIEVVEGGVILNKRLDYHNYIDLKWVLYLYIYCQWVSSVCFKMK